MGIYAIKPLFQDSLRGAEKTLVRHHVHPDVLTLGALALSVCGGLALASSAAAPWLLLSAPAIALARTVLNALDGMVAIDSGKARPFGEVLNEFSDRLSDAALFGGLAMSGLVNVHLGWLAVVLTLLTDDLGVLAKAAGAPRQYGGFMGKADRMVLLALAAPLAYFTSTHSVLTAMLALLCGGCLITIVQRWMATDAAL